MNISATHKVLIVIVLILLSTVYSLKAQITIKGENIYYVENYTEYLAKSYFDNNLSELDPIEGIWINNGITYSIEKDYNGHNRNSNRYRGVILNVVGNNVWEAGDIQFFFEKGVSQGVFNGTFYAFIAEWSRGQRDYNIKPIKTIGVLRSFASFVHQCPNFDDYGSVIGTSNDSFVKIYPSESAANIPNSIIEKSSEWSGTGFALKNGYIVTNFHVIDGAKSIKIKGVSGDFNKSYKASIIGVDKNNDLALLKIDDPIFCGFGNIPYSILSTTSEVGEGVFVLGYPLTSTMGDEIKLTTGIISSKTGFKGDVALYQISAPIQPGNSGGPLFNNDGNVIGVVSAKHNEAENVGYAIKASYLKNLIESTINTSIIPTNNTVSKLPLTGKVKSEKNFVFFIECTSKSE